MLAYCILHYDVPLSSALLLIPAAVITFLLSLLIGHFLAEPLNILVQKAQAFKNGKDVNFYMDSQLYEAVELSKTFESTIATMKSQQVDLETKENRETEFVSDVAHELRTPLTAIHGNAEMLTDPDLPPEMHDKFCSIIINESERLTRLVNDLLTLQRIENDETAYEPARVNLREVVEDVVDALQPILMQRHAHVHIYGEAPDVLGNADHLKQAVTNLVENASRFIKPEGNITIELCGLRNNSVIQVRDDGCGFGDIDPKLLFDRFYRTDASRQRGTGGTGLGLSIVKTIVEAHDGTVEAVNLPEGGACFIIAIPSVAS